LIHWLNIIGNNYGGLLAISGILLSIFLYLIPDISLPSWLKLLLVIVMLVSFHKLFVILKDFRKGVKSADDLLIEIAQSAWLDERPVGLSQLSPS